jgi:hypothetical protein
MYEMYRAWQHLANAGLVEGSYTGIQGTTYSSEAGRNTPASKFNRGSWTMITWGQVTSSGTYDQFTGAYGTVLILGFHDAGQPGAGAIMKPEDLYNIDTKLDDGLPPTGNVRTFKNSVLLPLSRPNCNTNAAGTSYKLTDTGIDCAGIFLTGF